MLLLFIRRQQKVRHSHPFNVGCSIVWFSSESKWQITYGFNAFKPLMCCNKSRIMLRQQQQFMHSNDMCLRMNVQKERLILIEHHLEYFIVQHWDFSWGRGWEENGLNDLLENSVGNEFLIVFRTISIKYRFWCFEKLKSYIFRATGWRSYLSVVEQKITKKNRMS